MFRFLSRPLSSFLVLAVLNDFIEKGETAALAGCEKSWRGTGQLSAPPAFQIVDGPRTPRRCTFLGDACSSNVQERVRRFLNLTSSFAHEYHEALALRNQATLGGI